MGIEKEVIVLYNIRDRREVMNEREYKKNAYNTLINSKQKAYNTMLEKLFEQNELLRRHYIDGETYKNIAASYGVTSETIKRRTEIQFADVKMFLAENGVFDWAAITEEEKAEYIYFRKVLVKKGITALHISDEVDIYTIARYLNVSPKHIMRKIESDKNMVKERLDRYGIVAKNNNVVNLYIEIFDENMRDFSKIPDDMIGYVYSKLTTTPELFYSQVHKPNSKISMSYWGEYTQHEQDRVDDKVFALKAATKRRMDKALNTPKTPKGGKALNHNGGKNESLVK